MSPTALARVPEAIAPGDARQLVGEEAGRPRLGARPHVARHPDAVPGPGAARGSLVRRHGRASTGRRRATNRGILRLHRDLDRAAARAGRRDAGLRGSERHDPARRPGGEGARRCIAGWTAVRTTTRSSSRTSPTGRSTTSRIGFPAPGRWNVRFNSDASGYARDFGGHEAFDLDADGGPLDGCEQSGLSRSGRTAW